MVVIDNWSGGLHGVTEVWITVRGTCIYLLRMIFYDFTLLGVRGVLNSADLY